MHFGADWHVLYDGMVLQLPLQPQIRRSDHSITDSDPGRVHHALLRYQFSAFAAPNEEEACFGVREQK